MTWAPLWLSYKIAIVSTGLAMVVGVAIAALLVRPWLRGHALLDSAVREVIDALVTVSLVLPPTVVGFYLLTAFGKRSWIGQTWEDLFGERLLFTFKGCVIASTVAALPLVVKYARVAMEAVDPALQQAARTLGAGPLRVFATVTLPLAGRGILAGTVLGFARALGEFGATLMVAGDIPGETQSSPLYIYDQISAGHDDRAHLMIAVLTTTAVAAMVGVNLLVNRGHRRVAGG